MKAFQHKPNLKHTAVLLFGIMMSCATVKAQDIPCLPSSFGETESQSAWCGIAAYTLHIAAHGESTSEGGWYLIASPVGTVAATAVTNLANDDNNDNFDLYRFDESAELEWENWKKPNEGEINHYHFDLEAGKGYLYANAEDVTLVFAGTPYSGDGIVMLQKTDDAELSGWNLVGNPFATTATLDQPYYRMNDEGSALKTEIESTEVAAMEGVFVKTDEEGQTVTFTAQTRGGEQAAIAQANIMVVGDNGAIIDNAILRFDGGQTLEKFQFREGSTKVYIPQDGKDYAVVNAESTGEMPVNFKAEHNGTYTLSVNVDNMEMAYLHLIDNLTGADVDLLIQASYTFQAKTTDYTSRFKLVFSANGNADADDVFAFIDASGNIIVNGEGTLQVIDVTGHILSSETVSGSVSKAINAAPGVYMLRLISADGVKVQKIVVR